MKRFTNRMLRKFLVFFLLGNLLFFSLAVEQAKQTVVGNVEETKERDQGEYGAESTTVNTYNNADSRGNQQVVRGELEAEEVTTEKQSNSNDTITQEGIGFFKSRVGERNSQDRPENGESQEEQNKTDSRTGRGNKKVEFDKGKSDESNDKYISGHKNKMNKIIDLRSEESDELDGKSESHSNKTSTSPVFKVYTGDSDESNVKFIYSGGNNRRKKVKELDGIEAKNSDDDNAKSDREQSEKIESVKVEDTDAEESHLISSKQKEGSNENIEREDESVSIINDGDENKSKANTVDEEEIGSKGSDKVEQTENTEKKNEDNLKENVGKTKGKKHRSESGSKEIGHSKKRVNSGSEETNELKFGRDHLKWKVKKKSNKRGRHDKGTKKSKSEFTRNLLRKNSKNLEFPRKALASMNITNNLPNLPNMPETPKQPGRSNNRTIIPGQSNGLPTNPVSNNFTSSFIPKNPSNPGTPNGFGATFQNFTGHLLKNMGGPTTTPKPYNCSDCEIDCGCHDCECGCDCRKDKNSTAKKKVKPLAITNVTFDVGSLLGTGKNSFAEKQVRTLNENQRRLQINLEESSILDFKRKKDIIKDVEKKIRKTFDIQTDKGLETVQQARVKWDTDNDATNKKYRKQIGEFVSGFTGLNHQPRKSKKQTRNMTETDIQDKDKIKDKIKDKVKTKTKPP